MARAKAKTKKTRKAAAKNYLVFVSSCGSNAQAEFAGDAATSAAAEKIAEKAMVDGDGYGNQYKAVFITKIEKTGKPAGGVVWA